MHHATNYRIWNRPQARRSAAAAFAFAFALTSHMPSEVLAQQTLNIATWGGAYGRAQAVAVLEPYARKTGTVLATEIYSGESSKLKTLIEDTNTPLDVVDVSAGALKTLCAEGLLAPIDADALKTDEDAADDFLPGAVSKCGVATMAWSTAIAFNRQAFRNGPPATIGALLDTARYPGKRALPNSAQRTLELALLADGVPPGNVYNVLATPEGADRAFAAIDRIKASILLWDKPAQPMSWVTGGRAVMAAGYSARLFRAAIRDRNIDILWDGQIYDLDAWAIPKTSRNKDEAMRFIRFATATEQLAAQARLTSYGPMRKSALARVGKHPVVGVDMQRFLPTAPSNFRTALPFDQAWWDRSGDVLSRRFAAWVASLRAPTAANTGQRKTNGAGAAETPGTAAP